MEPGLRIRLIASPVSSWKVSHLQHPLILDCFPSVLFRFVCFMYLWMFEKTSEEPIVFCCVLCFLYVSLSLCFFSGCGYLHRCWKKTSFSPPLTGVLSLCCCCCHFCFAFGQTEPDSKLQGSMQFVAVTKSPSPASLSNEVIKINLLPSTR